MKVQELKNEMKEIEKMCKGLFPSVQKDIIIKLLGICDILLTKIEELK